MATSAMRAAPPRSSSAQRKSSGNFSEQGGKAASVRGLAFSYTWSTNVFSASRTCHWPLELSSHALQIWPIQQLRTDGASQVTVRLTTAKCEGAPTLRPFALRHRADIQYEARRQRTELIHELTELMSLVAVDTFLRFRLHCCKIFASWRDENFLPLLLLRGI